ncbi:TadE family type IV pilus minor pilin [Streptomyces sp. NPDC060194]|uniref:TadE family type IV pilus minor pilin n=1 Tax=Streptomyces sp. NPDC060194 TaxID=3347069 RepID=UPI0036664B14
MSVEAAVVLPVLVLFCAGLVWGLLVAVAQIRCVDAARAGARSAARAEPAGVAVAAAREAAPRGAAVSVVRQGDLWRVTVDAAAPGPGGLGVRLSAEAVAAAEDGTEAGADAGTSEG